MERSSDRQLQRHRTHGDEYALQAEGGDRRQAVGEIMRLRAEIEALRNSTSWRITRPLRAASQFARGALRRLRPTTIPSVGQPTPGNITLEHTCRLCGGYTLLKSRRTVLLRYDVGYHQCTNCDCIQTDPPFWLEEAYGIPGVHIDVGIASRSIKTWVLLTAFLDYIGFPQSAAALDYGSATGLVARLMRDAGYNFFAHDKYSVPSFVNYFTVRDWHALRPQLITAFEVFEHFPKPAQSIGELLSCGADLIVFSTSFADGQDDDWAYYAPECGQHVFFYTERGLRQFAVKHGYELRIVGGFQVLVKQSYLISAELEQTFDRFSANAPQLYEATAKRLFGSVVFGSPATQADLVTAVRHLKDEIAKRQNAATL